MVGMDGWSIFPSAAAAFFISVSSYNQLLASFKRALSTGISVFLSDVFFLGVFFRFLVLIFQFESFKIFSFHSIKEFLISNSISSISICQDTTTTQHRERRRNTPVLCTLFQPLHQHSITT